MKNVKIIIAGIETKVKVFEKKGDLINKLELTIEEADLVIKYQTKFPQLLQEHKDKDFIVDARDLWTNLGEPQGDFSTWVKRKIITKNYKENTDYTLFRKTVEQVSGAKHLIEYNLTVNCAKKVAMRENTDFGDLVCDYFVIMEKTLRNYERWTEVRHPEKQGYRDMNVELEKQYMKNNNGMRYAGNKLYYENADMLNMCLFGSKSKELKVLLGVEYKDLLRDNLMLEYNKTIYELQLLNMSLIIADMDLETRRSIILKTCQTKYSDLKNRALTEFAKELKVAV